MFDRVRSTCIAVVVAAMPAQNVVQAAENYTLTLKNHRFSPADLEVPAGQKLKLVVKNEDPTPEEFESKSLKREKTVAGNSQITLTIGPLDPGSYGFYGEFHEESAQGRVIAK
jgi:plastocyanin